MKKSKIIEKNEDIQYRIFGITDLENILTKIDSVYDEVASDHKYLELEAELSDHSKLKEQNTTDFIDDVNTSDLRVIAVTIILSVPEEHKYLRFAIHHGKVLGGWMHISGEPSWVHAVESELKSAINRAPRQVDFFYTHPLLFGAALSLISYIVLLSLLAVIRMVYLREITTIFDVVSLLTSQINFLTQIELFSIIFFIIVAVVNSRLNKFWPIVEIQIGPPHSFMERNRRELLKKIIFFLIAVIATELIVTFFRILI